MDEKALFKLTYGLFVAGVEFEGKKNACIINTATQATSEPVRMIATMLKSNYTTELIRKKGSLTISVLSIDCSLDTISNFGYKSGRNNDKFADFECKIDSNGNPYIYRNVVARMSLNVINTIDLGSHYVFICDVVESEVLENKNPITYADYRVIKSGGEIQSSNTKNKKSKEYVCSVCHYVYDGKVPFEELPDSFVCPICGKPKSVFICEE